MLNDPVTISIAIVYNMLADQRAHGESCEALLTEAGIAPELLLQPDARITVSSFVNLMLLVMQRFSDEGLGFLKRPLKTGSFTLVARAAQDAVNLEQAIRYAANTFRLLQDDVMLELQQEGDLAGLALHFANAEVAQKQFIHELLIRCFWRLFAWLIGGKLPVVRFDFALPAPKYVDSYGKIFPAALRFEQTSSAFWFDAARLQNPVRRDDAALHSFLAEALSNIIVPRRTDERISERVRRHLQSTQPEWPILAITASALCMSTATLQRHLANEGTSFQTLKDELRRDMAIVRLNTSTVQLAALAQELGFTDSAAFQRAFKTWTGSAPGVYRRGGV